MKALTLATVALAALSVPALAGGPTVVADDPMPEAMAAPAAAHDWSGPYVGLSYGSTSGTMTYSTFPTVFRFDSGNTPSVFAGYLMQRGNVVYGGELAYSRGQDATIVGFPTENLENMLDLKGRVGYATGQSMLYGVLGYSKVGYLEGTLGSQDTDGLAYGLGLDVAVTQRFTLGFEYLARKTEGNTTNPGQTRSLDLRTVAVRAGLSF